MPTSNYESTVVSSSAFANLTAWWKLSDSPLADAQGKIGNGVIAGGVSFVTVDLPDEGDRAANFDGKSGLILIADDPALHLAAGTIHVAVDIEAFPTDGSFGHILSKEGSGPTDQDWILSLFNRAGIQELRFQIIHSDTVQRLIYEGITLGKHWITVNFGDSTGVELFVDGVLRDTSASYTEGMQSNARWLLIGASDVGLGVKDLFAGRIKHVQFYKRRLTRAEITVLSPTLSQSITVSEPLQPIWQSDEDDPKHKIGDKLADGLFSKWGRALVAFKPENTDLADAPGGGRAYRMTVPNDSKDSSSIEFDTVGVCNGGVALADCAAECEFYVPSRNWPGRNTRGYHGMRVNGHSAHETMASEPVVDGPRVLLLNWMGKGPMSGYVYYVNKPRKSGDVLQSEPPFRLEDHLDEWIHLRFEMKGGHGDLSGTFRMLINGNECHFKTGMMYHTTPGVGWRGMALVTYFHDGNNSNEPYSIYLRKLKMYDIS